MPFYDLRCPKCDKEFNISATMTDKIEKRIPCPECGATDLVTVYKSAPWVIKSASASMGAAKCPNSHVCGAGCRHAG